MEYSNSRIFKKQVFKRQLKGLLLGLVVFSSFAEAGGNPEVLESEGRASASVLNNTVFNLSHLNDPVLEQNQFKGNDSSLSIEGNGIQLDNLGSSFARGSSEVYLLDALEFLDVVQDYSTALANYITRDSADGVFAVVESVETLGAVSVVPEANTYAMLLAGIGVVGVFARRKKKPSGF